MAQMKGRTIRKENVTIIDSITGEYLDHINPENHSAPVLASNIYQFLERTKSTETLTGVSMDGCPTNVGAGKKQEGAIYFLENQLLKRPLMRSIGMLHLVELLMRHVILDICGCITNGPYDFKDDVGKIVKRLKSKRKLF